MYNIKWKFGLQIQNKYTLDTLDALLDYLIYLTGQLMLYLKSKHNFKYLIQYCRFIIICWIPIFVDFMGYRGTMNFNVQ